MHVNAKAFGFSPSATGVANAEALQRAVDGGGSVVVSEPGVYRLAATVYLGSHTALRFAPGVHLEKVDEKGPFSHVILNKGALTKTWDRGILVEGLSIRVNGMDVRTFHDVFGLHGQLAFFYVADLEIRGFRCFDLGKWQYGVHVCTFEDLRIDDVIIHGMKDGVHLGRGRRFRISNGVFETFDDAIALNAHDYDVGNPELGWIEDGVVENCHDLDAKECVGYFCRILGGGWVDWREGIEVQKSDTVVSGGRLYRVKADPDSRVYVSKTAPTHGKGLAVLDGITWAMVQDDVTYTAGVRNVIFRNIFLRKPRTAFSVHFDNDRFSRSYYPGAPVPRQEQLSFENVRVLHDERKDFLSVNTPMDVVTISHCGFRNNPLHFHGNKALADYLPTTLNVFGCVFNGPSPEELLVNEIPNKVVHLHAALNVRPES